MYFIYVYIYTYIISTIDNRKFRVGMRTELNCIGMVCSKGDLIKNIVLVGGRLIGLDI